MNTKYIISYRNDEGDTEYIRNDNGFILMFNSVRHATVYLYGYGCVDGDGMGKVNSLTFEKVNLEQDMPDILKDFVFKIWDCNAEENWTAYPIDNTYRIEVRPTGFGWDCKLISEVGGVDTVLHNEPAFKSKFREIPVIILHLLDYYNELMVRENLSLQELLSRKLNREWVRYVEGLRKISVDEVIDFAYETSWKEEIINTILEKMVLDDKEIKAMLDCENLLEEMYGAWMKQEGDYADLLSVAISHKIPLLNCAENDNK